MILQLKRPRYRLLEYLIGIIFLADAPQIRLVRSSIAGDGILPRRRIIQIHILIAQARFGSSRIRSRQPAVGGGCNSGVVGCKCPLDAQKHENQVSIAGIETEAVGVTRFGGYLRGERLVGERIRKAQCQFDRLKRRICGTEDFGDERA